MNGLVSSIQPWEIYQYFKCLLLLFKVLSIKDVRSQGGGDCPVRVFCGKGKEGILQMQASALYGALATGTGTSYATFTNYVIE